MPLPSNQSAWAFNEPKNEAAITTRQIIHERCPILLVARDAEDGTWQFLTSGPFSMADALLVALHEIVKHDPTVCELADLPSGWSAKRDSVGSVWKRSRDEVQS